jgi:hypothetical protein
VELPSLLLDFSFPVLFEHLLIPLGFFSFHLIVEEIRGDQK